MGMMMGRNIVTVEVVKVIVLVDNGVQVPELSPKLMV